MWNNASTSLLQDLLLVGLTSSSPRKCQDMSWLDTWTTLAGSCSCDGAAALCRVLPDLLSSSCSIQSLATLRRNLIWTLNPPPLALPRKSRKLWPVLMTKGNPGRGQLLLCPGPNYFRQCEPGSHCGCAENEHPVIMDQIPNIPWSWKRPSCKTKNDALYYLAITL